MTRRDYVMLSSTLRVSRPTRGPLDEFARICHAIADALAKQSAGFDKVRFLRDCGL